MTKHILIFLLLALGARAEELVTATIGVYDIPNNGDSITVNGAVRMWTNSPLNGVSWIQTTNTIQGTTTNLYLHVAATPFVALNLAYASETNITLKGSALEVLFDGAWASVSYATQQVVTLTAVRVPLAGIAQATNRVFIAGQLLTGINDYATNSFDTNAPALVNYLSLGPHPQTIEGTKTFWSLGGTNTILYGGIIDGATLTNGTYYGTVATLTGGEWTGGILISPVMTNGINYGEPFKSPGLGNESLQLGQSAEANADNSTAIGDGAVVNGVGGTALGSQATVTTNAPYGISLGYKSEASGGASVAIGTFANATKTNSMALGVNAQAVHDNSIAMANDTATTSTNQIRLGNSGHVLSVPGNATFGQKLLIGSSIWTDWPGALDRGLLLANGTGPGVQTTNSVVYWTTASEAFYRTGSPDEGAEQPNRLHNRAASVTSSGTAYPLTASTERIDFSGQDPEILLPTAGTYLVTALVEIANGASANDEYRIKFRNFDDDVDIVNSERATSTMAASAISQLVLQNIITVDAAKAINLWGYNATAARGNINSERTSLLYVRLY